MENGYSSITTNSSGRTVLLLSVIIGAFLLALHAVGMFGIRLYAGVFLFSSFTYLLLARVIVRSEVPDRIVLALVALSLLLRATFLFAVPAGSDDIFRYLWDGKVQAAGINPYLYPPNAPELAALKSNILPSLVNHPDMRTVYFPVSQWIFFLSYSLGGEAVWPIKAMLLLTESLTLVALWGLTRALSIGRSRVLLYALCPLPIIQFSHDAHLDGFGMPVLAFALLLFVSKRRYPAMLLFGISMAIKPVALVLLPVLSLQEKGLLRRAMILLIPFFPFALQFIPYLNTPRLFEGLLTFSRHWTFNGPVFELANAILSDNLPSRFVCTGGLVLSLLLICLGTMKPLAKLYLSVLALMIFSPVVHPWYICWLVVLLPLVPSWSGIVYAATASLTVFTVVGFRLSGTWEQHPLILAAEYLPVLLVLGGELLKRERGVLWHSCPPAAGGQEFKR
jgi:alpha-1,6-mannosyltransferase